ncbi:MAG: hypothetical protein QXK47_04160 [Candidatus Bathyarchaeia archaeon]
MSLKLKTAALVALLIASVFTSCLLAYENSLLKSDVATLRDRLESLEGQHNRLLGEYEALLAAHQRLLEEEAALNRSYSLLQTNHTKLLAGYAGLEAAYADLNSTYAKLLADYVSLTVAYASLNSTYAELLKNYTALQQQAQGCIELQSRYEALLSEYQTLQANYSALSAAYNKLYFAVYKPLYSNETATPTLSELKQWLAEDKTNEIPYTYPDFICGDFAVMLSIHAKMERWDMGIVAVIGRDASGNEFDHAFNTIRTVEGLVYVEPQNDQVFYGPISEGAWYSHPGFGKIYVETFIIVVPYQPPL